MPKILKAIYGAPDKPLKLGDFEIPCYVLDNEKRILVRYKMMSALGMKGGGAKAGSHRLLQFVEAKSINPFVSKELAISIKNPIKFVIPGRGVAYGYEAKILADICDTVLAARKAGALQPQQFHIAAQCEDLMRAFAIVGIVALVDEATGYQEVRDRQELHKILENYISPELMPWAKRFPDEFYQEIFRLNGWAYDPTSIKRPGVIGTWTNKLIYEQLPPGILTELKEQTPKNPKGKRQHQYHRLLTADIGNPHLERQLAAIIPIMRLSPNWRKFKENFAKAFRIGQQRIEIEEDE